MSTFMTAIEAFHFIRPLWLLSLPIIFAIWLYVRRQAGASSLAQAGISEHLRDALTIRIHQSRAIMPIDGAALVLSLALIGASGPTWSRMPDPFVAQTAPLAIVLKVTPSMDDNDVKPSRLERAKQKISDLLPLRAGARTALVAYSGTVHIVVPMTEDPNVMQPYLEGLTVDVMPKEGDNLVAAVAAAKSLIAAENSPGGVLLVADEIAPADANLIQSDEGASLAMLSVRPPDLPDKGTEALAVNVVAATIDDTDIRTLDRYLNAAYRRALARDGDQPWEDRGWLLAWPAALLALLWFRRGWTMQWLAIAFVLCMATTPDRAMASGLADWFLTADQQGQFAYRQKDYDGAASTFTDPLWKGWALYRAGKYQEAAQTLAHLPTAEAAILQGMAHIKARQYREGIAAFETALARQPQSAQAASNLETARQILAYVEEAREQSDTGENTGPGADDMVFDNKDARGQETATRGNEGQEMLSADQWMNTVDTGTSDFLRQRFAVEALEKP